MKEVVSSLRKEDTEMESAGFTVIKLKSGEKRIQKTIYLGRVSGKSVKTTIRAANRREWKQKAANARVKFTQRGQNSKSNRPKKRIEEVYDEFFNDYYLPFKNPAPSTRRRVNGIARNYILRFFANKYIDEISVDDCDRYLGKLHKSVSSSFNKYKQYTAMVFKFACHKGYIEVNPFDNVLEVFTIGNATNNRRLNNVLSRDETIALMTNLKDIFPNKVMAQVLVETAIFTGLRRGELLALKWGDVDLKRKNITVTHTIVSGERGGSHLSTSTKTPAAHRTVPIGAGLVKRLSDWKAAQGDILKNHGLKNRYNDQYVFSNTKNSFCSLSYTQKIMDRIRSHMKFQNHVTFHGLRHTFASLQHEAGVNDLDSARMMGHTDVRMTKEHYIKVHDDKLRVSYEQFEQYMSIA